MSKRAISAPNIADMNPYNRVAHQRNEKSADTPVMSSTPTMHQPGREIKKGNHAGHSHGHHSHNHGPSRPWMIGH